MENNKLQTMRKARGLTQVQLSQKATVCRTIIARHETGRCCMSTANLAKVAKALGCRIDDIIGGKSDGAAS